MSESEPSRLQMSTANMGMGGSLPPLSLPPLSLPPMKTDPLGLSPHSYNSISQLHSPIPNTASPSNHVNSPQPQMFNQPPSSPLAYGNGSPRQMPVKRRFPMGQEPGSPFQQRQGMESLPKQMKVLPGPPVSGANPPISPMRFQEPVASPSSSFAPSPSNVPSPSTSHHLPNGNGPVHPQALKTSQASAQPVPMQMPPQPHPPQQPLHPLPQQMPQQHPVNMAEFRGTPNGTFHPAVSSAPSPNLYHKPRPVEANAQVHQLQHLQMRPSTSHQPNMVQPGHHMQNLPNAQMPVPQMFPTQQHHMFPTQGIPGQVIGQPPVGFAPMPQQQGPPQQRMAMQHPQTVQIIQQRMIPGQGVVPVVVQQAPPPQQQQQQAQQQLQPPMSQQQIKNVLANRIGTAPVNGPSPSNTPALQQESVLQVLTRTVGARVGQIVSGQLNPTHANIPVRTILSAFQPHQMANGRPGIPVSLPMHPGGQPMIHQATVPRSNPTAAMQLARMIDERMAPSTSSKDQYRAFKKKFKYLVYENECYQEELRNLQRKLLKLSRDKNFLLDRLMQFEKVSDSSDDDSDSSQKTVDDRPKTKKRIRTQKRKSSPHIDGVNSASGTPSPCPSPAPGNLLAQMLQPSTSSGVFSPPGDARLHHPEQQMRMEDRRQFLLQQQLLQQQIQQQQHSGEREMRHPFAPREPAAPMGDPVINGYPAGPHFPSQSSSVPAQSSSHLNGQLPSTPGVAPPASEELDQKPVP